MQKSRCHAKYAGSRLQSPRAVERPFQEAESAGELSQRVTTWSGWDPAGTKRATSQSSAICPSSSQAAMQACGEVSEVNQGHSRNQAHLPARMRGVSTRIRVGLARELTGQRERKDRAGVRQARIPHAQDCKRFLGQFPVGFGRHLHGNPGATLPGKRHWNLCQG